MDFVILFRFDPKPQDVQYLKFDENGHMYLYEPGSGCNGTCYKVVGDLVSDGATFDISQCCDPTPCTDEESNLEEISSVKKDAPWLKPQNVHKIIPKSGSSLPINPTNADKSKRSVGAIVRVCILKRFLFSLI